jgi:hypothetical protein
MQRVDIAKPCSQGLPSVDGYGRHRATTTLCSTPTNGIRRPSVEEVTAGDLFRQHSSFRASAACQRWQVESRKLREDSPKCQFDIQEGLSIIPHLCTPFVARPSLSEADLTSTSLTGLMALPVSKKARTFSSASLYALFQATSVMPPMCGCMITRSLRMKYGLSNVSTPAHKMIRSSREPT